MNKIKLTLVTFTLLVIAGCSSVTGKTVSDQKLREKAAFALETSADRVTISNRRHEGMVKISFNAKVGRHMYQCYITTVLGAASSDAICAGTSSKGKSSKKRRRKGKSKKKCNALLKAAGRC